MSNFRMATEELKTLLITGSRGWNDLDLIQRTFDLLQLEHPNVKWKVIHGGCRGADLMADEVAKKRGWFVESMPVTSADWRKHGKKAGFLRNTEMIWKHRPHHAIAFQLNDSPGTGHCIQELNKYRGRIDTRMKGPVTIVRVYDVPSR